MAGLAAVVVAVASGCVSLQANGPVTSVAEGDAGSSQVQIWPSPPQPSESATAIVTGFLQAARSGATNLSIAEAYLTSDMQKQWQSEQSSVIVLADDSETVPQPAGQDAASQSDTSAAQQVPEATGQQQNRVAQDVEAASGTVTEQVQGNLLGTVDSSGVYAAYSGAVTYDFGVTDTKQGFRISSLPPNFGVLMERTDFEASYDRHDVYYENAHDANKLIPTQIYLPAIDTDQDIADAMAKVVVQGVPDQLGAAMQDSVQGAQLKGAVKFTNDGSATVTVDTHGACAKNPGACQNLGEQLAATLNALSTKVTTVNVLDQANNKTYAADTPDPSLTSYGLSQGARSGQPFYAVADDGQLERVDATFNTVHAAELGYGETKTKFKQVAVGPTRQDDRPDQVALVSQDGGRVYVQRKQDAQYALSQIFPSVNTQTGGTVGALSWDAQGVLWFTVTRGGATSVYRYGADSLSLVTITGQPGPITQVAAAPDGSRVAVAYKDSSGDAWIEVAAAVQDASGNWLLEMGTPEVVAADWSEVIDFDWYNEDSLAVLGLQPNSQVLGLYQVYADGSAVYDSLTDQPVQAVPPANAASFVWSSGGQPIAAAPAASGGKNSLYWLSVEGQDAQLLSGVTGISPSY
jgi:hypothetical protein